MIISRCYHSLETSYSADIINRMITIEEVSIFVLPPEGGSLVLSKRQVFDGYSKLMYSVPTLEEVGGLDKLGLRW